MTIAALVVTVDINFVDGTAYFSLTKNLQFSMYSYVKSRDLKTEKHLLILNLNIVCSRVGLWVTYISSFADQKLKYKR